MFCWTVGWLEKGGIGDCLARQSVVDGHRMPVTFSSLLFWCFLPGSAESYFPVSLCVLLLLSYLSFLKCHFFSCIG